MTGEQEINAQCPYCHQPISFLVDAYSGSQSYIEDCEVCCRPIQISYEAEEGEITGFTADRLDD
ncbi:MAG: CPXCG motif-containing cysteine-rich protein [Bdellovibrionota bacterium]